MPRRSKTSACPSVNAAPEVKRRSRGDEGYVLVIMLMLATVLLISLTAALPSIYTQGQREKEEELIFRGTQYSRAIALFRRQFRRFPTSTKELLQTNGQRFLRHEYTDPMTRLGKWRFIHADAMGTPIDSRTFTQATMGKPLGDNASSFTGSSGTPGFNRPSSSSSFGGSSSSWGSSTFGGSSSFSSPSTFSTPSGSSASSSSSAPNSDTEAQGESSQQSSSFFGNQIQGAFIIGVASMSSKKSIRVYNNKNRYSDWEFLGIEFAQAGIIPGMGGQQPGGLTSPGQRGGSPGTTLPPMPPLIDQPTSQ